MIEKAYTPFDSLHISTLLTNAHPLQIRLFTLMVCVSISLFIRFWFGHLIESFDLPGRYFFWDRIFWVDGVFWLGI